MDSALGTLAVVDSGWDREGWGWGPASPVIISGSSPAVCPGDWISWSSGCSPSTGEKRCGYSLSLTGCHRDRAINDLLLYLTLLRAIPWPLPPTSTSTCHLCLSSCPPPDHRCFSSTASAQPLTFGHNIILVTSHWDLSEIDKLILHRTKPDRDTFLSDRNTEIENPVFMCQF